MGGRHGYDAFTIFGSETPATFSGDSGSYTLCTLVGVSTDGWLAGIRLFIDDADIDARLVAVYETLITVPLVTGLWRGQQSSGNPLGTSGSWRNVWLHPWCRLEATKQYFIAAQFPSGNYWFTSHRFDSGVGSSPIEAQPDNPSGFRNGAFTGGCVLSYPSLSFNATWYGIDVLYVQKPVP